MPAPQPSTRVSALEPSQGRPQPLATLGRDSLAVSARCEERSGAPPRPEPLPWTRTCARTRVLRA